ncbi:MAG: PD-(D/E)XK nuclease family protein [Treponema sp.]|jgi:CRISPR/Cas system-associated exonuclease Cas4 (RecB family)|nr:PD-(D/E)XK nuclease family protein [Treponema sp.]
MNSVDTILLENIDKPDSLFIFPTNVAASRWADRVLILRRQLNANGNANGTAAGTIAMEKFIAWDTFKQNSIRSKIKNRQSIPSVLRRMFVSMLIRENAEQRRQGKTPVFSSLIRAEWAYSAADSFGGWLTEMLPQLGAWFRQTVGLPIDQIAENAAAQKAKGFTGDDSDLFTLALRYAQFLEKNGLFEPAWEIPPFEDMGKECFIFFPESLSDFSEYRDLLAASGHVKTIYADDAGTEQQRCDVFFYTNSRSEITEAALYILALHQNQNVPWDSISVSIPDDAHYGPYLLREFANRNIPCIRQSGKPLALYPAGQFFAALAGCASADFSFASVKELLLNQHLPWKDSDDIQALIEFGIKNNCIGSWTEEENGREIAVNVWEDAFTHPFGGIKTSTRRFFEDLKQRIIALCGAGSFSDIRKQYFAFRGRFFDMEKVLSETDIILSRCISELMYLVEMEKSFPDVKVPNPYAFFTGYLREVTYLAQQSASGVAILPYRTAAPAPFDCHIILDASQGSLSAVFSPLAFLPKSKREKLAIRDHDASLTFIKLHRFNSRLPAAFFCSEQTFSGYTIPHSALNAPVKPRQRYGDDIQFCRQFTADLYREESDYYASLHCAAPEQTETAVPAELHKNQKQGFEKWQSRRQSAHESADALTRDHPLLRAIRDKFCYNEEYKDKFSVSSSSLAPYFQCPLIWIFSRVLNLENVEAETGLMANNITGDVYHAVLNLFLNELKLSGEPIAAPLINGDEKKSIPQLPEYYSRLLAEKVETVFESFPRLPAGEYQIMSMLTARLLRAEKPLFFSQLENFLAEFISCFAGFKVIATEENYSLPKDNYFLNGRIDCILEDIRNESPEKNSLAIIDFKTKYKIEDSLANFQLPLYLRLAEMKYKKNVTTALFFSITDSKPLALFGVTQGREGDDCIMRGSERYNEIMHEFDQKAALFAQEISSGTFSFFPSRPEQCQDCEYNKVCRTLYRVYQGKNNGI